MKGLPPIEESYFEKFSEKPVKIKPFNPATKQKALLYIQKLEELLKPWGIKPWLSGSTALEISGKGEIEIELNPSDQQWEELIQYLKKHFGGIGNLENDYARFNDSFDGDDIEVIVEKGRNATVKQRLMNHLKENPNLLKDYEDIKNKYSYSKREYYRQKDRFLRSVVEKIPE